MQLLLQKEANMEALSSKEKEQQWLIMSSRANVFLEEEK